MVSRCLRSSVLLAALIAAGFGGAVLLLVVAVRGTVIDATKPPNRLQEFVERAAVTAAWRSGWLPACCWRC